MTFRYYEEMAQVPVRWKGPAMICPVGHQMHPIRFSYCESCFKDAHCKGGCGWIDQSKFILDGSDRLRTEGRKITEDPNEPIGE